jgi:CheY-like chemotaxis protein
VVVEVDADGRSLAVRDTGPGFGTAGTDASPATNPARNDAQSVERRRRPRPPAGRHGHGLRYGREIMMAHGGDLMVRDSPAGAAVVMRLAATGPRVLVVDADAARRATLVDTLHAAWPGCECAQADNGPQALQGLVQASFDLVVAALDRRVGGAVQAAEGAQGREGLALLSALRGDPRWDTLPVLLVAQVANTEALAERELEAAAAGADGFLDWPVEVDRLARALEAVFTYEAE